MEKGTSMKKDHQESKKKKNQENRSKASHKVENNNNSARQKNAKKNKPSEREKPVKKNVEKPKGSSFLWLVFVQMIVISVAIGLLYLVDYEKFSKVRLAANASLNKTLGYLPPEVLTKGRNAFEVVRPFLELILSKLSALVSGASTFLNTNPIVRDHWALARDVSSVCGALFVDYLRTLYLLTCRYLSKLMPGSQ